MGTDGERDYFHLDGAQVRDEHEPHTEYGQNLVHDLARRLDRCWVYEQYITNALNHADVAEFWRKVQRQEQDNIRQLNQLIQQHVQSRSFSS